MLKLLNVSSIVLHFIYCCIALNDPSHCFFTFVSPKLCNTIIAIDEPQ